MNVRILPLLAIPKTLLQFVDNSICLLHCEIDYDSKPIQPNGKTAANQDLLAAKRLKSKDYAVELGYAVIRRF
ncbi:MULTISPECIES: hypothetical protein [unclassified Mesorhizobium]|uniref:hypothetical protein n=1 Tax=unclassified Mesorhizobium TaxID=325217 RepID=UPI000FDBD0B2|nr:MULTISPECIES: hypothetical protein [unclassified Mesorhizobium]TGR39507.1 hypothetical protein EN842_40430 [bacterium M00.F.Ca.ET.199.01.1.1]TGU28942.1 hypothetical protein EN799_35610 [bacterium M00.F.Ca.ET.156.01.1.1]TGV84355.1 hypothetical protein EN792_021880 [Mesorhizobium sp. M00.F.Ca.ET.149.01.1.1]TIT50289.1 MAG: hypothetical protein E5W75_11235 [Mesorhizobium sp.]TGR22331.1 hypothetical protein EN845_21750 [Mesorhizobium sp. M8A.F.Ca.ET.202.01.1.1]